MLEDRYGLTGPIAGIHTNLDLFIGESGRPLVLGRGKVAGRESYRVDVADDKVELTAEDDEGMRRALCYFVDRVYARDLRSVTRRPWLRDRICRSFVGPLGTPPQDRDDLADDVERYPPSYLDRLAARGFNGIWIPAGIGDFAKSEDGERSRRIAKLRELRDRSALYGIKVWLQFKTEGDAGASSCVMCRDQSAEADRIEAVAKDVFKEVPGLGGAIVFAGAESSGAYLVSARSPAEKQKVAVD